MRGIENFIIRVAISIFFVVLVCASTAAGKVIYVDGNAVAEFDGSNWVLACRTLQDAIAQVRPGDEIRVAKGIYKPNQQTAYSPAGRTGGGRGEITESDDRTETFVLINGVTFKGGYAGFGEPYPDARDIDLYETILNGDLDGNDVDVIESMDLLNEPSRAENSYHVLTGRGTAVLDGFTVIGGNANAPSNSSGGGFYNQYGVVEFIDCTFKSNSAKGSGGAIYNELSNMSLINCTFIGNSAGNDGGGVYNSMSNPNMTNCIFIDNSAVDSGGGIFNGQSDLNLDGCTFSTNWAQGGGAIYNNQSNPNLTNCTFSENSARYGGGIYNSNSGPDFINCAFRRNSAIDYGGGIYNFDSEMSLFNCIFTGNEARYYGAGISNNSSKPILTNCTFSSNSAPNGSSVACSPNHSSTVVLINCILWDNGSEIWSNERSTINISYSNIQNVSPGTGVIVADPLFADPNGPDNVPGTEDDDLRLAPLSPCIDTGDPQYMYGPDETDFDDKPRVISGRVDMGAYEFPAIIYVDSQAYDGPDQANLLEDGSVAHPFDTIQEAIDIAKDRQTVLVRPGVYESINFEGKAIAVSGAEGAAVIEAPLETIRTGGVGRKDTDGVTFHTGEGPGSVLKNFIIRNSSIAISLNYGSSPTITNLTIVDNNFGISAYEDSNPDISNCIFFNNRDGDLFQCQARYSCFENEIPGVGNISGNPLFVDPAGGDYHLMSEGWRWNMQNGSWTWDFVTSPCVDAGDPISPVGDEPMSVPRDPNNEYGINQRINMGAYGGTCQASMAPLGWFTGYETAWSEELSAD